MKTNIVVLSQTLLPGGAEKQAVLLARILKEKYKVIFIVIYSKCNSDYLKTLAEAGIETIILHGLKLKTICGFKRILKKEKIDIIFSFLLLPNFLNGFVGKIANVNIRIGSIRSAWLKSWKRVISKLVNNYLTTKTVFNNYYGFEKYSLMGFNKNKMLTIPNAIGKSTDWFVRPNREIVEILMVGRFDASKDYFTALDALGVLNSHCTNFKVTIIGYGSLEPLILERIENPRLNGRISVVKSPDCLNEFYMQADIFLQTSIYEGLSNTIMEAMTFGLPIVATDVGDTSRLCRVNNGFLCSAKNHDQISYSLEKLINDYGLRIEFGKNSYEIIAKEYSFERFKKNYFELIQQCLEK